MALIAFTNCRLIRNGQIECDDLWVRNGKIMNPEKIFFEEKVKADVYIDCHNVIIAPGYIDVQINGAFGIDFSTDVDKINEGVIKVAGEVLRHGVTSFCPTIVTSSSESYKKIIPNIRRKGGSKYGAAVLGIHIEGPFINKEKKGAHSEKLIRSDLSGGWNLLEDMYGSLENVSIFTIAPELPGALSIIKELRKRNIKVSLGHSMADLNKGIEAVNHGANFITHLFNAMLPFHHRDPHLVGLLATDLPHTIYYGMITDGVHTHSSAIRIAQRTHPKGLVIVTDATPAMGLTVGKHHIGTLEVEVKKDGRAVIAGTQTLAGSIATMDECVRHLRKATNCSIVEAIESASLHPAQLLGIETKGRLNAGCDADFVFLDDDLYPLSTWIAGEKVFDASTVKQ